MLNRILIFTLLALLITACDPAVEKDATGDNASVNAEQNVGQSDVGPEESAESAEAEETPGILEPVPGAEARFGIYEEVRLTADLTDLSANQKEMITILIEASEIMDRLFWRQAYGEPENLLNRIPDAEAREFARINYGPWDRLNGNKPFLQGVGPKPPGANYYPEDMTKEEFEAWQQKGKTGQYSLVRRNDEGELRLHPYSEVFADELQQAAELLRQAANLAEDPQFANYLRLRADAFLSDEYQASDMAWMDMKQNPLELVIGPIENYEDQLFGYRSAFESYVLVKDMEWSGRLSRFAQYLPELQQGLPVPEAYRVEMPGSDADLNAYDVVYYAGDCNAGSKTIAINLPNDEEVQLAKGTRRLQLKNAMRAKFDRILVPISDLLIAEDQRGHITFDAFFANTMFHEVAHGLGIKNTLSDSGSVREVLKEHASALEEGKADVLGLYMVQKLRNKGEITEGELMDNYVTFLASIFRSIRFGASSAHGTANMIRFNYFLERDAFSRNAETGTYRINVENFEQAVEDLSRDILILQGEGDYAGAGRLIADKGVISEQLQADLVRLQDAAIPVDIVFEQGVDVLGIQ